MARAAAVARGERIAQRRAPERDRSTGRAIDGAGRARRSRVEPRDGLLYVFMPPVDELEDYLELLAAVEETARELGVPRALEGYPPPLDPRIDVHQGHARSRRDRGQHPSGGTTGTNCVEHHDGALRGRAPGAARHREVHARRPPHRHRRRQPRRARRRDAGRQPVPAPARPAAQPDRATGTTIRRCRTCSPACSSARPARRRASTRRGTTALYELEIAFAQIPSRTRGTPPPWLVDRLFRNLLIDVTGNTHRAEFCIDKLYSPDGPTGRLGLRRVPRLRDAAARAHEPGAAAAAARARSRGSGASRTTAPLVRWGTELHDRFMLPHFVWHDFDDVIDDLQRAGYAARRRAGSRRISSSASRATGSVALRRRRRSSCGRRSSPGTSWARKARAGGTARYVDSSVERLQVKVTGLTGDRHVVDLQRPASAAARRPDATANPSRACATAPGSRRRACTRPFRCMRRWSSTSSTRWMRPLARRLHLPRRASRAAAISSISR